MDRKQDCLKVLVYMRFSSKYNSKMWGVVELLWQVFLSTQRLTRYTDGGCEGGRGGDRSGGDPVVEEPALPV